MAPAAAGRSLPGVDRSGVDPVIPFQLPSGPSRTARYAARLQ
jgi:hypothetical protein